MDDNYLIVNHLSLKDLQRIFSRITIDQSISWNNVPCWNWTGYVSQKYGIVSWHERATLVHRLLYAWIHGPLPTGTPQTNGHRPEIDHLCRNTICCNPVHLELVSRSINGLRSKGIHVANALKTSCKRGHPFTPDNIKFVTGGITCKTCTNIWSNENYHNRKHEPDWKAKRSAWAKTYRELRMQDPEYREKVRQRKRDAYRKWKLRSSIT